MGHSGSRSLSCGYTGCVRFQTSATQEGISKNPIHGLDTEIDICGSLNSATN